MNSAATNLKIGEVAAQAHVNLQTIRYYERENLLPKPARLPSGYRVYTPDAVRRVRFIKRAQELGFTLAEIRELLALRVDRKRDRSDVRQIAAEKVADIERKILSLTAMKNALVGLTDHCSGHGPASECPILESLDSEEELRWRQA
ncbi:MAG: heavy metal-responsive transcriptional regulator [Bryobacteraceae bacterium]